MSNESDLQAKQETIEIIWRNKLNDNCDVAGIVCPAWPWSMPDVVRFTDAMGYRADGDFILGLVNKGALEVPRENGRLKWDAIAVAQLMFQLEGRRRWRLHPNHLHKLSNVERAQLEAEAEGKEHAFHDLDKFDVEQLLHLMADAEQHAVRHALRIAIQAKLRNGETL